MASTPEGEAVRMVYAASPVEGGTDRPGAIFSTIDALKAYTGWTPADGSVDKYGTYWRRFKVWGPIPMDPPRRTGGRKKTARRRRGTARKH